MAPAITTGVAVATVVIDPATREACVVDPLLDRLGETTRLMAEHHAVLRWIVDRVTERFGDRV